MYFHQFNNPVAAAVVLVGSTNFVTRKTCLSQLFKQAVYWHLVAIRYSTALESDVLVLLSESSCKTLLANGHIQQKVC